jgi:hypothetical protein
MVRVAILTKTQKEEARVAGKILGLRQAEFYRRAIIEKTQNVLASMPNEDQGAPSTRELSREEGAPFFSEDE